MSAVRRDSDTTPQPAIGWEECERIAERVAHAVCSESQRECERDGAVAILWKEFGKMKDRVKTLETHASEAKGAAEAMAKSNVRTVQILAVISGVATVLGFILNHWPHR